MMTGQTKMRVCFVSPKAYPLFNPQVESVFGGAEVDLYLLATELANDERFQVRFIVADYGQERQEERHQVRLFKSLSFNQSAAAGAVKVWRAMQRADADIYMHEACSMGTALIGAFCRRHKRAFVYRTAASGETDGAYFRTRPLQGWFVRRALRRADALIVQNQKDAENAKHTIGRDAIVIPNGWRVRPVAASAKTDILWVGRSHAVKRPELFVQLAALFPAQSFVMICQEATGDPHYDRLVEQAKQVDNLTFIRRVPFDQIDRYFEQAKVLVNTSDAEGFPNTFVQACGAQAAILSKNVNPDGFLTEHRCGVCGDGTFESLVSNLRLLLTDQRYAQLGQSGLDYVRQRHNIETIVEEYKRLFYNLKKS